MDLILFQTGEKDEIQKEESPQTAVAKHELHDDERTKLLSVVQQFTPGQICDKPICVCTDWFKYVTLDDYDHTCTYPVSKSNRCK